MFFLVCDIMSCRPNGRNKKKNVGKPENDGSGKTDEGRGRKRKR